MNQSNGRNPLDYEEDQSSGLWDFLWDLLRTWGPPLALLIVIRSSVAEPFRIPSGSMVPTLEIGDHILVTKMWYSLKLPWPLNGVEVWRRNEPARGDIIVFRYPLDPSQDYIKRVVGVPGDRVEVRNHRLFVNDAEQALSYTGQVDFVNERCRSESLRGHTELLDGHPHAVLTSGWTQGSYGPITVPAESYFVMGDNRDHSADSRVWKFVPRENIKGKALWVWLSLDFCGNRLPVLGDVRQERFGMRVQ